MHWPAPPRAPNTTATMAAELFESVAAVVGVSVSAVMGGAMGASRIGAGIVRLPSHPPTDTDRFHVLREQEIGKSHLS